MKVIDELWYGNLKMCEREVPQKSPLRKSMNQVSKAEEKLTETLNEEQLKMLETLMDKHLTLTADLECDAFTTGVRFGARMMMEILDAESESFDVKGIC